MKYVIVSKAIYNSAPLVMVSFKFYTLHFSRIHRMISSFLGLRAEMGVGSARMNVLTVGKAASGLAAHLPAHSRILLGYDHRHNSLAFAQISVRVFEGAGHVVSVFPEPVPTPFVAGGLRMEREGFALGIMITASHNPRPDNGYKVYNSHGAQILDADAGLIAEKIAGIRSIQLAPEIPSFANQQLLDSVFFWYQNQLSGWLNQLRSANREKTQSPKVVYTPMHGVGGKFVQTLMRQLFSTGNQ
jgi:phosphomannomutase